jgi:hypothetical protein
MNHWETVGRMAAEHRADLDREAVRAGQVASVRAANPTSRPTWHSAISRWLQGPRALLRSSGRAGHSTNEVYELQVEV